MLVQGNPLVKGTLGLGTIWFRTDFPLSSVALWVQWQLWGNNPVGYHVVNVLLHATSAVLLWRLLSRLRIPGGWLAGVLFAVHPVCVASVAWISELKNTLSLPFYLVSALLFLRGDAESATPRIEEGGWRIEHPAQPSSIFHPLSSPGYGLTYWLSLLAFLLALLSKTSTVMLPVVLLACTWWQRGRLTWRDLGRTGPYFAVALAFGVMSVWYQAHGAILGATVQTESIWGRLAGAGMALWFYLGKALLPVHLSMIYPRWTIHAATPTAYLPLLLWGGLLGLCWWFRRSWGRCVLFGLGCFTLNLLPVLGFVDMYFLALSRVSDHFAYLPLTAIVGMAGAGLCLLAGDHGPRTKDHGPRAAQWSVVGGLVVLLSLLTAQHAKIFVTEQALWEDTLAKNPGAWIAHANLGWMLASQGKYDAAISHLAASLQSHPNNAQARCNLGRVLSLQGKFSAAEPEFQAALKLKPKDASIRRSYGSALAEAGRKEDAVKELREAIRLQPDVETHLQLAKLFQEMGQSAEAAAEYRQVLARQPASVAALSNLAWLLATCSEPSARDGAEAVRLAEKACQVTGHKEAQTVGVLAAAYAEAGRFKRCGNKCATGDQPGQRRRGYGVCQPEPAPAGALPGGQGLP